MSSPVSIGDILALIDRTIIILEKIRDAPEKIEKIGKGMKSLRRYLAELKELLDGKAKHGLAATRPSIAARIKEIVIEIEKDTKEVEALLDRWHHKIGPGGFELRFTWVADALFAIGSSPGKLDALSASIEKHQTDLDRELGLLKAFGQDRDAEIMKALLYAYLTKPNGGVLPPPRPTQPRPPPPPPLSLLQQPRPSPNRFDYKVIFIGAGNERRSIIAEAYYNLLRGWTEKHNGTWRIKYTYSAGYRVKWRNDCLDTTKSVVKTMEDGNKPPGKFAVEALFGKLTFNDQFKTVVRQQTEAKRSRGVWKDLFAYFDYIFMFNQASLDTLKALRDAFRAVHGASAVPAGKGKLVHLGSYTIDGKVTDFLDIDPSSSAFTQGERWIKTQAMIKNSFKVWLIKEMGWKNPSVFATAASGL